VVSTIALILGTRRAIFVNQLYTGCCTLSRDFGLFGIGKNCAFVVNKQNFSYRENDKNAQNLSIFSIIGDKVISLNKTEFKFEKSILLLC